MSDRLKDIWSGFASQTERRLTGKGVDNIIVPHRTEFDAQDRQFLPDNYESPAERAFSILRADLARKEKKFSKARQRQSSASSKPLYGETPDEKAWGTDDLNVGLWSTAMRVERTELDYDRFLDSNAGRKALKRSKRKKFLGIF